MTVLLKGKTPKRLAACLLALAAGAGQAGEPDRRYFNEVFEKHVRTAGVVYAEHLNDTTGRREKLTMRVFEPAGDTADRRPLLILTPGGAFMQHEEHWMDEYGEQIARAGYVVAVNRFRLSDSVATHEKYLDALFKAFADQKAVIRYFAEDAKAANRFRVDPHNIFVGGHSAGAITALHVAYLDPADRIDGAMAGAMKAHGGLDGGLEAGGYTLRGVVNLSGMVTDPEIVDKGGPALLSIHGDRDTVVPAGTGGDMHGSIPVNQRAESQGLDSTLYLLKGALHNDPADPRLCPECIPLVRRFMFNNIKRAAEGG